MNEEINSKTEEEKVRAIFAAIIYNSGPNKTPLSSYKEVKIEEEKHLGMYGKVKSLLKKLEKIFKQFGLIL